MLFIRRANITMPPVHRDIRVRAEIFEPSELIVNQRLQRTDIKRLHGVCRLGSDLRKNREESSFGLATRGGRSKNQIILGLEDSFNGVDLKRPQLVPTLIPNSFLDLRMKLCERRTHASGV